MAYGGSSFHNYSPPHFYYPATEPTIIESIQYAKGLRDGAVTQGDTNFFWQLEELVSYFSHLFFIIILINKFVVEKDYRITQGEVLFVMLLILKTQIPIVGFVTFVISLPPAINCVKDWFKNNVNKRAELETELRLLDQF